MGGVGSGPQKGGGGTSTKKLTIQHASQALSKLGYTLGRPTVKNGSIVYNVKKGGESSTLSIGAIKKKISG